MADKVDRFALYRIKYINEAEATYYQQLGKVLADIEKEIIETVDTLPTILDSVTKKQKLFQLKTSIDMRPKIQAIIEKHYPRYADRIVREGFNKQGYRRFNISGIKKGDDYAAMSQALSRHYSRSLKESRLLPDIILVD